MTKDSYEKAKYLVEKIFQIGASIVKVKEQLTYENPALVFCSKETLMKSREDLVKDLETKKEQLEKEFNEL